MKAIERIYQYIDSKQIKVVDFERKNNISNGYLSKMKLRSAGIGEDILNSILENCPDINPVWLLSGKGEMLKSDNEEKLGVQFYYPENLPSGKRLIPLYDDVSTIGGKLYRSANMDGNAYPSEWIDPGDWFRGVTHAIRHYGDSMIEYPPGSILALKEVKECRLIVPGKDYVIETSEDRLTKKIQLGNDETYIRAHSTNYETYPDGTLVHQPFNILLSDAMRIFEVLGYVVKKGGGTIVTVYYFSCSCTFFNYCEYCKEEM